MLDTLSIIGKTLENQDITWGVGGSLLLSFYGIIEHPNDIDVLVDETDAVKFNEVMASIGKPQEALSSPPFRTRHFNKYTMKGTDIDVMGGFAIQHDEGIYKISLEKESIVSHKKINEADIPLCALEDWYVLYWFIPNKREKALLIEKYFRSNGVSYPRLLKNAQLQSLPLELKERIENLLS